MKFPIVGSVMLFSLFLAFKFLPKHLVNLVLSGEPLITPPVQTLLRLALAAPPPPPPPRRSSRRTLSPPPLQPTLSCWAPLDWCPLQSR